MIEIKQTSRGFLIGEFKDRYGAECTIQESSLATEACIWLGVSTNQNGEEMQLSRMHLTQDMARELIPILRHFARTGTLGTDSVSSWVSVGVWITGVTDPYRNVCGRIVSISKGTVTIQNEAIPGESGLIHTLEGQFDLFWEQTEDPSPRLSAIDALLEDDDDDD